MEGIIAYKEKKQAYSAAQQYLEHQSPVAGIVPPGCSFDRFAHNFLQNNGRKTYIRGQAQEEEEGKRKKDCRPFLFACSFHRASADTNVSHHRLRRQAEHREDSEPAPSVMTYGIEVCENT
jgi:hypothetical protein